MSWTLAVESSNRAARVPLNDGVVVVKRSTIDGLCLGGFRGVCMPGSAGTFRLGVLARMVCGEPSGEREGKEVRALSIGIGVDGAVDACRCALMRTVPDL